MKKQAVPSYLARTKWFFFALVALILIVFGRTVETPSLTKSAVVLGIGIDYKEDTSLFTVSAQCVLVGSSSGDTSETTFNTYSSSGNTISGAMDGIARKMGLIISLAHCNVVVMSQSALALDHLQLIYPLTGMYALPEQTIIVSCPDSPENCFLCAWERRSVRPSFATGARQRRRFGRYDTHHVKGLSRALVIS